MRNMNFGEGQVAVVVGLGRGDEGKGRVVDDLAGGFDIVARGNGGPNAGHRVSLDGVSSFALHVVPSGIAHPGKLNVVGNGVFVDPIRLEQEIRDLQEGGLTVGAHNLAVSFAAHLITPRHVRLDELREGGDQAQGSTRSGIAFVASDKSLRAGVRLEDVQDAGLLNAIFSDLRDNGVGLREADDRAERWISSARFLLGFMADTRELLTEKIKAGERVLAEGAQAFQLDIDHGMYPYVTSSSTTAGGVLNGLGIAPHHLGSVFGVTKLVASHVGGGPFVTEINDPVLAAQIRGRQGAIDAEYGATTGRERRVGYPDMVALRPAVEVNGVKHLVVTKLDHAPRFGRVILIATAYNYDDPQRGQRTLERAPASATMLARCAPDYVELPTWRRDISSIRHFEKLPGAARMLVKFYESELEVPVTMIGVGPGRDQAIWRERPAA